MCTPTRVSIPVILIFIMLLSACAPSATPANTPDSSPSPAKTNLEEKGQVYTNVGGKNVFLFWSGTKPCELGINYGNKQSLLYGIQKTADDCTVESISVALKQVNAETQKLPEALSKVESLVADQLEKPDFVKDINQEMSGEVEASVTGGKTSLNWKSTAATCSLSVQFTGNIKSTTGYQISGRNPCTLVNMKDMLDNRFNTETMPGSVPITKELLPEWEPEAISLILDDLSGQNLPAGAYKAAIIDFAFDGGKATFYLRLAQKDPLGFGCDAQLEFEYLGNTGSARTISNEVCSESWILDSISGMLSEVKRLPEHLESATDQFIRDNLVQQVVPTSVPPTAVPTSVPPTAIPTLTPLIELLAFNPKFGAHDYFINDQIFRLTWATFDSTTTEGKKICRVDYYGGPPVANVVVNEESFDGECTKDIVVGVVEKWKSTAPESQVEGIDEILTEIKELE